MKTNYIQLLLGGFLLSLCFTACYKDLGNYDYHEINQVDSITGVANNYPVLYGDTLRIVPQILATEVNGDTGRYSYRWEALIENVARIIGDEPLVLIGTGHSLAYPVKLRPAPYDVFYRVKDKQTGVEWFKQFKLVVQSAVYQGWVALCDVKGGTRLDMVARLGDKDKLITDVLSFTNAGIPVRRQPKQLVFAYRSINNQFYLRSGEGLEKIDGESLTWKSTYNVRYEMMTPVGTDFAPDYFFNSASYPAVDYVIAGDRVFHRFLIMGGAFGSPINYVDEEKTPFRAAPFIACGFGGTLLYDQDHQRFVAHDPMFGTNCSSLRDGNLFSYSTGRDMVYMSYTNYNWGDVYAVLKDKGGKFYTYCMNIGNGIKQVYYTEMTNAPELDKATAFAVSNQLGYLFYAAGGRVYEYDVFTNKAKLMADLGAERVSVLKCLLFNSYGKEFYINLSNSLVVGSYDPSRPDTENGAIRVYSIPARNEQLQLTWSYAGLGKIVDLAYRER
ncbi:PKD-like family protein [Chitinophaga eiseniae]|uniref:PKD-like family protein n=1 Tax=Chitinophaga eiseniae TaxID=634771 RepID=A0A1T4QUS1_9BACT|nr:PKD-like family lipoprotein [Chitinophaga eiseniae]SKA07356.1 PKD-like family protein [Chitinophaga eiseniae]